MNKKPDNELSITIGLSITTRDSESQVWSVLRYVLIHIKYKDAYAPHRGNQSNIGIVGEDSQPTNSSHKMNNSN